MAFPVRTVGSGRMAAATPKATTRATTPVVLVLTSPPNERELEEEREAEMKSLLDTAGRSVVGTLSQHLQKPVSATYLGSGKIEELAALMKETGAEEAVFDVQLSPRQQRNLRKEVEPLDIVDYNQIILEIFARNARTAQAMLAVELAQLEYNRSRLKRLWTHLDRQGGGGSGGASAMRGTGEKQIEVDKRLVRDRILELRERLEDIEQRRERTVAARGDCFNIALVGYTNAGKSTLMNALTKAGVLAEDRLFATLDTRTARVHLDGVPDAVLSDTVGFIRNLPPTLIASFHATLAEVREADLLLHVIDCASASMDEQVGAVEGVLEKIGASKLPTIMVFNKVDRTYSKALLLAYRRRYADSVEISALTGEGLDQLKAMIAAKAAAQLTHLTVRFDARDGALSAFLRSRARVTDESYEGETAQLTLAADARLIDEVRAHPGLAIVS
jgi:GTP-binding protein HflX